MLSLDNNNPGNSNNVQVMTIDHGASVDETADVDSRGNVVQVLSLDDGENPQVYLREGGAEILRLEDGDGTRDAGVGPDDQDGSRERPGTIDLDHPATDQVWVGKI